MLNVGFDGLITSAHYYLRAHLCKKDGVRFWGDRLGLTNLVIRDLREGGVARS